MHLPNNQPDTLSTLAQHIKSLASQLIEGLSPAGKSLNLMNSSDILASHDSSRFFLVKSGQVQCQQDQKLVYSADEGDLIGLLKARQYSEGPFTCEGEVVLVPYSYDELEKHYNQSPDLQKCWADYLLALSSYFSHALAHEIPKQFKPATGFLQFDEGDVIINQGEKAECVYTLLEGSAEVIHDEVKVGEIKAEETFGAIAVFTNQARNATVVATSSCSVLAVRKDEFLDLVSHQPQVCMSMIEEMADKINQLNKQVLSLQQQK